MGGYSKEYEISLKSGNTVFNNIDTKFYNAYKLIINKKKMDYTYVGRRKLSHFQRKIHMFDE